MIKELSLFELNYRKVLTSHEQFWDDLILYKHEPEKQQIMRNQRYSIHHLYNPKTR